jgi:hypothetical protein
MKGYVHSCHSLEVLLDRYLLPGVQQNEAETIRHALDVLFRSESEREP